MRAHRLTHPDLPHDTHASPIMHVSLVLTAANCQLQADGISQDGTVAVRYLSMAVLL